MVEKQQINKLCAFTGCSVSRLRVAQYRRLISGSGKATSKCGTGTGRQHHACDYTSDRPPPATHNHIAMAPIIIVIMLQQNYWLVVYQHTAKS